MQPLKHRQRQQQLIEFVHFWYFMRCKHCSGWLGFSLTRQSSPHARVNSADIDIKPFHLIRKHISLVAGKGPQRRSWAKLNTATAQPFVQSLIKRLYVVPLELRSSSSIRMNCRKKGSPSQRTVSSHSASESSRTSRIIIAHVFEP